MKKHWIIIFVLIILLVSTIYILYHHPRRFKVLYMTIITRDLVYKSENIAGNLKYRFYKPKNEKSSQLPLIVYLHGAGQRGDDNKKQLDDVFYNFSSFINQKDNPSYIIAPQCPVGREWVNRSNKTIPYTHYSQDETIESTEMKLIVELIKECIAKYPIDINRIYITGFSMGASGTWDILTRYPDVFAGAAIFAGVSDTTKANLITHIPIWAFSGEDDDISPARLNEDMCNVINAHNGNCKFTEFKEIGHDCVSKAFDEVDIIKWLFSQKKEETQLKPH